MVALRKQFFTTSEKPMVKVIDDLSDDTKTVIRFLPTPYGSPDKKDLHGDYFTSDTYFGDDFITVKFGLYEHFMNDLSNPVMAKMGKAAQILGSAHLVKGVEDDDAGRWFQIEVARSMLYHDALVHLVQKGLMGASTQAFQNSVERADDGFLKMWVESEVSLTPTPANPDSIAKMLSVVEAYPDIFKSFSVLKDNQLVVLNQETVVDLLKTDVDGTDVSKSDDETSEEDAVTPVSDLESEIAEILGDEGDGQAPDTSDLPKGAVVQVSAAELEQLIAKTVQREVKTHINVAIDLWGDNIEEMRQVLNQLIAKSEDVALNRDMKDALAKMDGIGGSFRLFADAIKKMRMSQIGEDYLVLSQAERDAVYELEQKRHIVKPPRHSMIPKGAPGSN